MVNQKYVELVIKAIEDLEDDDRYTESYEILASCYYPISDNEYDFFDQPFDLASSLHNSDGAMPMHPSVAAFVLSVYFDEYAKGSADAACNLGSLYYTGRAGEQNYAKAVEYYTFAADNGSREASENLGYCYYYGRDVEIDYEKSYHYFVKGALDGHIRSLYKVGDFYKNGYYVKKDEKEAFYIYSRCLETLTEEASKDCGADVFQRIATCYHKGIGVKQDLAKALRFYQLSESMFYERLKNGDYLIASSLDKVIAEEEEVRKLLRDSMPDKISYAD